MNPNITEEHLLAIAGVFAAGVAMLAYFDKKGAPQEMRDTLRSDLVLVTEFIHELTTDEQPKHRHF